MMLFASALGCFATAWIVHLVWWRIKLPHHHTKTLLKIFGGVPILLMGCLAAGGASALWTWADWIALVVFHGSATLCYLITYAGVEETSPSLVIVRALEAAGPRGLDSAELQPLIRDEDFILPRITSLERDDFISCRASVYYLTPRGRSAARSAAIVSKIFGIRNGA